MTLQSRDYDQLVSDVRNGNTEVVEKLYNNCYPPIKNMILQSGGQIEDTLEVFQDAMVKFYENTHKKDFELHVKPSTYLYSIAKNIFMQQRRKSGKTSLIIDDENYRNIGEGLSGEEREETLVDLRRKALRGCLDLATKACNTLLLGKFYENRSLAELATELDLSTMYVRVKMHRCKQMLKRCVNKKIDKDE